MEKMEKDLISAWKIVQAEVKHWKEDSDYALNIYVFPVYEKFGETIRAKTKESVANSDETELAKLEKLRTALDKLNYQKLQQTLRYINDIRHNRNGEILQKFQE